MRLIAGMRKAALSALNIKAHTETHTIMTPFSPVWISDVADTLGIERVK